MTRVGRWSAALAVVVTTVAGALATTAAAPAGAVPTCTPGTPSVVGRSGSSVVVTLPSCSPAAEGTKIRVSAWVGGVRTASELVDPGTPLVELSVLAGSTYRFSAEAVDLGGAGPEGARSAVTLPPFATTDALIDRQFQDFAGRAPTTAERDFWRSQITSVGSAVPRIAGLQGQPHWQAQSPVIRLYRAYFLRLPDLSGLQYWAGRYRAGTSLNTISAGFAGSQEFKLRYGSLSNRAFVERVYLNVLGRPGDGFGIDFWTAELNSRRRTRGQVMTGFSESGEYKRRTLLIVDTINVVTGMLRRVPTSEELSRFAVGTVEEIITEVMGTNVYAARPGIGLTPPPMVVQKTLSYGSYGQPYSDTLSHQWGQGAVTYTASGLPPGLSISPAGVISGAPEAVGDQRVTITVTDAAGRSSARVMNLALTDPGSPVVGASPLPTAYRGDPYTTTVATSGGAGDVTLTATGLPAGLTMSASGQITGTPTGKGDHTVTVTATDELDRTGTRSLTLTVVPLLAGVVDVAAGARHSCALLTGGTVSCWGANDVGQLGLGSTTPATSSTARAVPGLSGVTALDAGGDTTCALVDGGAVRCWGEGTSGQIGDGNLQDRSSPTAVSGLTGVTQVSVGTVHACARTTADLSCWGANGTGQLGVQPATADEVRPTPTAMPGSGDLTSPAAGLRFTCAASPTGLACWGDPFSSATFVPDGIDETPWVPHTQALSGVTRVVAGDQFACALHGAGVVSCWGSTYSWQVTEPDAPGTAPFPSRTRSELGGYVPSAVQLAAGGANGCLVGGGGTAWCWGANDVGQIGIGSAPVRHLGRPLLSLGGPQRLAVGDRHVCAATSDGRAWCWGEGAQGRLGDGTAQKRTTPVRVVEA